MLHVSEKTQAFELPSEIAWLARVNNILCCTLLLNSCCSPCFKNTAIPGFSDASRSCVPCSTGAVVSPSTLMVRIYLFL